MATGKVIYEVLVRCEEGIAEKLSEYMQSKHLKDILDTGCFASIDFEQTSTNCFRTRYLADSQADLDRYLNEHTVAMREDFVKYFPTGVTSVERVNWKSLLHLARNV